jgi:hypothetical protein
VRDRGSGVRRCDIGGRLDKVHAAALCRGSNWPRVPSTSGCPRMPDQHHLATRRAHSGSPPGGLSSPAGRWHRRPSGRAVPPLACTARATPWAEKMTTVALSGTSSSSSTKTTPRRAQAVDDMPVVHHLVPHVQGAPVDFQRALDDVDCALDTRAETARIGQLASSMFINNPFCCDAAKSPAPAPPLPRDTAPVSAPAAQFSPLRGFPVQR